MTDMLSDRIRSGSEAAPWVIESVKKLEAENTELKQKLEESEENARELMRKLNEEISGPVYMGEPVMSKTLQRRLRELDLFGYKSDTGAIGEEAAATIESINLRMARLVDVLRVVRSNELTWFDAKVLMDKALSSESERDALQAWKDASEKADPFAWICASEKSRLERGSSCVFVGRNKSIRDKFPLYLHPAPAKEGYVLISEKLVLFLNGESPLEGKWFGEMNHPEAGKFWWRKYLPEAQKEE